HLKDGTSTVTWRVVSADGHPVHGGLAFSVGARSAISAVAGSGNRGAGRVVGWGYGAVRFLWFGAFLALVGMVALRAWVWTPAVRATGLVDSPAAARFRARFARALPLAWVALAVAGGLELVFQTASVSGLSLVSLGSRSWRMLEGDERVWLVRQLVPRFSRVAIVAVTVVVATGVLNALFDFGAVSDLWRLTYGRVVLAKVIVLGLALALAAR